MASDALLKAADFQIVFSPEKIFSFLKQTTNGISQKDLIKRLTALRDAKANYRETPKEREKRERNQREYELARSRQRMMERGAHERS
jgi:DNA-binding HxlR family transcriptional regulator